MTHVQLMRVDPKFSRAFFEFQSVQMYILSLSKRIALKFRVISISSFKGSKLCTKNFLRGPKIQAIFAKIRENKIKFAQISILFVQNSWT